MMFSHVYNSTSCSLKRDITERGRELNGVLKQYNDFVKPVSLPRHLLLPTLIGIYRRFNSILSPQCSLQTLSFPEVCVYGNVA